MIEKFIAIHYVIIELRNTRMYRFLERQTYKIDNHLSNSLLIDQAASNRACAFKGRENVHAIITLV